VAWRKAFAKTQDFRFDPVGPCLAIDLVNARGELAATSDSPEEYDVMLKLNAPPGGSMTMPTGKISGAASSSDHIGRVTVGHLGQSRSSTVSLGSFAATLARLNPDGVTAHSPAVAEPPPRSSDSRDQAQPAPSHSDEDTAVVRVLDTNDTKQPLKPPGAGIQPSLTNATTHSPAARQPAGGLDGPQHLPPTIQADTLTTAGTTADVPPVLIPVVDMGGPSVLPQTATPNSGGSQHDASVPVAAPCGAHALEQPTQPVSVEPLSAHMPGANALQAPVTAFDSTATSPPSTMVSTLATVTPATAAIPPERPTPSIKAAGFDVSVPAPQSLTGQLTPVFVDIGPATGLHKISLHLTPTTLGHIVVQVDQPKVGPVSVTLTVDRPKTLSLLQQDTVQLGQALDRAGISATNRVISFHLAAPPEPQVPPIGGATAIPASVGHTTAGSTADLANTGSNTGGGSRDRSPPAQPHPGYATAPVADDDSPGVETTVELVRYRLGLNITA
jgi:hypothetical protein